MSFLHLQAEQQLIHRVTTEQQHEHNNEQQVELQQQYDQLLERLKGRSSNYITLFHTIPEDVNKSSTVSYLIGQKFGGPNCRKSNLLPKILSADNFCQPKLCPIR